MYPIFKGSTSRSYQLAFVTPGIIPIPGEFAETESRDFEFAQVAMCSGLSIGNDFSACWGKCLVAFYSERSLLFPAPHHSNEDLSLCFLNQRAAANLKRLIFPFSFALQWKMFLPYATCTYFLRAGPFCRCFRFGSFLLMT